MQVRVFESPDMASGLKQIKKELGPDALILSTRTIRSGKMGLLGKPVLEITAAIDTDKTAEHGAVTTRYSQSPDEKQPKRGGFHQVVDDLVPDLDEPQPPPQQSANRIVSADQSATDTSPQKSESSGNLQNEVNELKDLVKSLAGQIQKIAGGDTEHSPRPSLKVHGIDQSARPVGNPIQGDHLLSMLVARGINIESARTIAGFLRESHTDQELSDPTLLQETVVATIQNLVEVCPPDFANRREQRRIALVGPTGVGKTTTLAKIAAAYLSRHTSSVALLTIDTYRIAAVEQLKVYGEIMHLPVEVVITPEQLANALTRHQDKELILIDTAGRSPRDRLCIDELGAFLLPELEIEKHLVLSATTRENELLDTVGRFRELHIDNTIFTKIDECATLGILLNIQIQNPSPLSYLTNGQRVPEDLLEITPRRVAELIMSNDEGSFA